MKAGFAQLIRLKFILLFAIFSNANGQFCDNLFRSIDSLTIELSSLQFQKLKNQTPEIYLIDTIWNKSKRISSNYSDALLTATFSALPFREFPVVTPFLKIKFGIPLPVGPLNLFEKKFKNLPFKFLFNSPNGFGDRDKLSHFFGNAFLTYNAGFFTITKFMGILVELFENNFKENGEINLRDMQVNYLGGLFGLALRNNPETKPSDLLKIYNIFYLRVY